MYIEKKKEDNRNKEKGGDGMKKENGFFDNSLLGDDIPWHIRGISCNVSNCIYHDGDAYCTAPRISVGPGFASCCTDTVCATFKAKGKY